MFYKRKFVNLQIQIKTTTAKLNEMIKAVQQERYNNKTALELIEGQDKLLQKLIPTINRHNNQIKKLEESYQLLVMVCEKIVSKIDPEWNKKNESVKKTKTTSEKVRKSTSK